jgi:hypothetical protein
MPAKQRRSFGPGEDHNHGASAATVGAVEQRRGFGTGEDHNESSGMWQGGYIKQRRGFGPAEGHNYYGPYLWQYLAGQRRASALARITTRPMGPHSRTSACSAGASAPARITTVTSDRRSRKCPRQRRSFSPARITTRHGARPPTAPPQRRGFGPGEDHNEDLVTDNTITDSSARASASARITTGSASPASGSTSRQRRGFGLARIRGSQHPDHRRHAAARMLAAASVLPDG